MTSRSSSSLLPPETEEKPNFTGGFGLLRDHTARLRHTPVREGAGFFSGSVPGRSRLPASLLSAS